MTTTINGINHRWARNAANCALGRAALAKEACGLVWRGGSIGYMGIRHPSEGSDQSMFDRYEAEVDAAGFLQSLMVRPSAY